MNKKAQFGIWGIIIVLALAVISLALGIFFVKDISAALGSKWILYASIVVLLLIFHNVVEKILMIIVTFVKRVLYV